MCGRFALRLNHDEIQRVPGHQHVRVGRWVARDNFVPRYNIAPRTNAPVIRRAGAGPSSSSPGSASPASSSSAPSTSAAASSSLPQTDADADAQCSAPDELIMHTMKWGLVPFWSKHEDKSLSTTNARSESLVAGGGMWGPLKGRQRCAVVCQGYYEWLTKDKEKLPHFIKHKDGQVMLMAGLYDRVVLEGQTEPLWTFTIVTTEANKEFSWLHERQPVILSTKEALDMWLDTSSQTWTPELSKLTAPFNDDTSPLECYQVPKEVGKVGTESPTFIEPVATRKDGIQAMFSKQKQAQSQSQNKDGSKPKPSTAKRKRSTTPELDPQTPLNSQSSPIHIEDDGEEAKPIPKTPVKSSSTSKQPPSSKTSKRPSSPQKKKAKTDDSSAKITSFFGKAT